MHNYPKIKQNLNAFKVFDRAAIYKYFLRNLYILIK